MAQKTIAQLESELAQALSRNATLESDNQHFGNELSARDARISELQKALAASGKEKPPVADSADEKEIRRRMSGGISRKHAEEAHAAQVAHNKTLAAADED
jgi:hypothetical protein